MKPTHKRREDTAVPRSHTHGRCAACLRPCVSTAVRSLGTARICSPTSLLLVTSSPSLDCPPGSSSQAAPGSLLSVLHRPPSTRWAPGLTAMLVTPPAGAPTEAVSLRHDLSPAPCLLISCCLLDNDVTTAAQGKKSHACSHSRHPQTVSRTRVLQPLPSPRAHSDHLVWIPRRPLSGLPDLRQALLRSHLCTGAGSLFKMWSLPFTCHPPTPDTDSSARD